jgi:hypothetical protein
MPPLGERDNPMHITSDDDRSGEVQTVLVERDDRRWWPLAVSVGASVLSAILAAVLCLSVSERNAQRGREARAELTAQVCAIVVALDENYRSAPPATPVGKRNAASMSQLRVALGCPPA